MDQEQARRAKQRLAAILRGDPAVNGVGLTCQHGQWMIRVNVLADAPKPKIPKTFEGVTVCVRQRSGLPRAHSLV